MIAQGTLPEAARTEALVLGEEAVRLLVALVVGGAIGLNRNLRGKAAGLRTHALVSLGAAVAVLLGGRMEPEGITRVAQGVITGIGFIGAGVILHPAHGETRVRGLTTAATVWVAAALGMAAGLGDWSLVVLPMLGVFAVLIGGGPVEDMTRRRFLRERRRRLTPPAGQPTVAHHPPRRHGEEPTHRPSAPPPPPPTAP